MIFRAPVCLLAAVLGFAAGELSLTIAAAPPTKSKSKNSPASVQSECTVEDLVKLARPSVVVISHVGRDGAVDGVGAGVIVSPDGLIATCLHVIGEGRPVAVQLADGRKFNATAVHAWDRKLDLAVIRIAATNLLALPLGDSDLLKQGAPVVAIGNPRGLEHSVVQGIVSARRQIGFTEMIQLAIPVEPGNSGGPLLDLQGRVHGLLTLKSAMTENLGFATPVNDLKPLLDKPSPVPMERWITLGALNPREWTTVFGGHWTQKAGRIQADTPGNGFGGRALCLSQRDVPARPYEVAVTVKLDDEAGAAGIAFASDGADVHYGFYPSAGRLRLTRFDGPNVFTWTILKEVFSPHYKPGDWNTLKVRVEKDRLLCYVNGELAIESNDTELTSGRAGLAKFRDTKAVFKNFQLARNIAAPAASAELTATIDKLIGELPALGASPEVLAETLQPRAKASQSLLMERARKLEQDAARLRQIAQAVHQKSIQTQLVKTLDPPEEQIDLSHAALLVAKFDNDELDVESYRRQVEQMARELSAALPPKADDEARLAALNRFLFQENGFHGSRTDYYNRANSYLSEVLDDREGIPITLSVLYLELARLIGLERVEGVPLPGHFVVRLVPRKGEAKLIDVFDGGKMLSRTEAEQLVELNTGQAGSEEAFQPATKRQIIIRMLRNLSGAAARGEPAENPLKYFDLILALSPDEAPERRGRAALRLQAGDSTGAREDLIWLREHHQPGVNADRLDELLRSLQP